MRHSEMLEAQDSANAALLLATQPAYRRIIEIRLRPMVEPLSGREQDESNTRSATLTSPR